MGIILLSGGMHTTIQDAGRYGYQQFGVSVSGSMDVYHHILANLLVGNPPGCEVLECTIQPPNIRFDMDNIFALSGAPVNATLNGKPLKMHKAYLARKGDELFCSFAASGCRTYLAFSGGLDVPSIMGSKSTYLKGGIGGLDGRALQKGDRVDFAAPCSALPNLPFREIHESFIGDFLPEQTLRIIPGPQLDAFSAAGMTALLTSPYTVTNNADRMGYRLEGARIKHAGDSDGNIISDAITKGAVQVPGHGQPIIMMADRQTTGGYAKIGHIISVDLPKVAQLRPGNKIRFALCSVEKAQELLRQRTRQLRALRKIFAETTIYSMNDFTVRTQKGKLSGSIMRIE